MNNNKDINFENGLIPAIVQDYKDKEVLMMAFLNKEAWNLSVKTGYAHFYSRSRNKIWKKGESSGHLQEIKEIRVDCDNDTILFMVNQIGNAACHTGHRSCFYRTLKNGKLEENSKLVFNPKDVYKE